MLKKLIVCHAVSAAAALTLFVSAAYAASVTQEYGFNDVAFSSSDKLFCKGCHGDSLVSTHHETGKFEAGACVFCHAVTQHDGRYGVVLLRDCLRCHLESPHHKTEAALSNECTSCHDTPGLSDYSTEGPDYGMSKVTPEVSNCGRCHGYGTQGDLKIVGYQETHHQIELENCDACHLSTDPKSVNIRVCERCHNVKEIHNVPPHVEAENCVVCHISKK